MYPYQPGPNNTTTILQWRTSDWDPALRFWALPFDPRLTAWLPSVDQALPSILAAREFASQHNVWKVGSNLVDDALESEDLAWQYVPNTADDTVERNRANGKVRAEIEQLHMLMQDDRDRYLSEIEVQADGLAEYVIHYIGADRARHPWTVELISCGLAIGNVAYMHYKSRYRRVRPSYLCPALTPAFGPPSHPSFPSGHSFLGHLIALLLLEIPSLAQRYGIFGGVAGSPGAKPLSTAVLDGRGEIRSPLLWLAQRLAKNRERLGVHYPSDSSASRHLAAAVWRALLYGDEGYATECPTLVDVLTRASAEW